MEMNEAQAKIPLLSTGAAENLKYSLAVFMLPIPSCIPLFVKVNYFIGVEKKKKTGL